MTATKKKQKDAPKRKNATELLAELDKKREKLQLRVQLHDIKTKLKTFGKS